jgi:hypothetical protein
MSTVGSFCKAFGDSYLIGALFSDELKETYEIKIDQKDGRFQILFSTHGKPMFALLGG